MQETQFSVDDVSSISGNNEYERSWKKTRVCRRCKCVGEVCGDQTICLQSVAGLDGRPSAESPSSAAETVKMNLHPKHETGPMAETVTKASNPGFCPQYESLN